jgi:hypothetical protein
MVVVVQVLHPLARQVWVMHGQSEAFMVRNVVGMGAPPATPAISGTSRLRSVSRLSFRALRVILCIEDLLLNSDRSCFRDFRTPEVPFGRSYL